MSRETETKIARSAARLRLGVIVIAGFAALLYAIARLGLPLGSAHLQFKAHGVAGPWAAAAADTAVLLLGIALFRLVQMLGRIAAGELFSAVVIARFRGFAFWLLMVALFGILVPIAVAWIQQPEAGQRILTVMVDFTDLLTVGITLLLFLLARLLERAREIEAEMREIV